MKTLAIVSLVALTAMSLAAEAKHGTTESKTYFASDTVLSLNSCASSEGIGGVRFCGVDSPAPSTVTVRVTGFSGLRTGAQIKFVDAGGAQLGPVFAVCGARAVPVPIGTAEAWVFVSRVWGLPIWQGIEGCIALGGESGRVTLEWSVA